MNRTQRLELASVSQLRQQSTVLRRSAIAPTAISSAQYTERDTRTGQRRLTLPNGGVVLTRFISTSQPEQYPVVTEPGRLGLSGWVQQRPV